MQSKAITVDQYVEELPEDRKQVIRKIREVILSNLPEGFVEIMIYGMIGYVIPHSMYPKGYHSEPKLPLPLINLASQKKYIAMYHMGIYGNKKLLDWFVGEFAKQSNLKLDMGKGCIRFKKMDQIPYSLIGELTTKMSAEQWIKIYETNISVATKERNTTK